jgi:hypothetical protein
MKELRERSNVLGQQEQENNATTYQNNNKVAEDFQKEYLAMKKQIL